jgi:hypothetical protein
VDGDLADVALNEFMNVVVINGELLWELGSIATKSEGFVYADTEHGDQYVQRHLPAL